MASYRFNVDHSIGQFYYPAGTIASTADSGGTLPTGWVPSPNVDPLDNAAVTAFFAAGAASGFPAQSYSFSNGNAPTMWRNTRPVTYWVPTFVPTVLGGPVLWSLTGLGVGMGAIGG
jgi:hypothetical protein